MISQLAVSRNVISYGFPSKVKYLAKRLTNGSRKFIPECHEDDFPLYLQ